MCFRETPFTALQQGDISDLLRVSVPVQINRVIIKFFCRAYSVTGLFYLKVYMQLTHTNAPMASSMHHAGVAVHPHYSVVGCESSPCFQPVLTVVVVLKQPSLIIHTSSRDLLQQSVLVDYCCFHLASSGASTALGSYIGHRNRRRLLSTLREEFVGKKKKVPGV